MWISVAQNLLWLAMWCVIWDTIGFALGFIVTGLKVWNNPPGFLKWLHLIMNIYLCSGRYCLMEKRSCSLVSSIGGGYFLLVCTYKSVPNDFSLCSYSSMSLLIYFSTWFSGEERGTAPMSQVFYVGIIPGGGSSFFMVSTRFFWCV